MTLIPFINQLANLVELDLNFDEPPLPVPNLEPLSLPSVVVFTMAQYCTDIDLEIHSYIAKSRFSASCTLRLLLTGNEASVLALNPLFSNHTDSSIFIDVVSKEYPLTSTVLSTSDKVYFLQPPSAELFNTRSLPQLIVVKVGETELEQFMDILDALVISPHSHRNTFLMPRLCYEWCWTSAQQCPQKCLAVELVSRLQVYVQPLAEKGVNVLDNEQITFESG
jgi:hypothetical protein